MYPSGSVPHAVTLRVAIYLGETDSIVNCTVASLPVSPTSCFASDAEAGIEVTERLPEAACKEARGTMECEA
jgi:hypothetical protein